MFWAKKKLYEIDPKELSLEHALLLQSSLLAKLLLVSKNLQERYVVLAEAGQSLDQAAAEYFSKEAKRMNGICLIVDNVLAQQVGKAPR